MKGWGKVNDSHKFYHLFDSSKKMSNCGWYYYDPKRTPKLEEAPPSLAVACQKCMRGEDENTM